LASVLDFHALSDLSIEIDSMLGRGLELIFEHVSGEWLVGCFPAQRYMVVHGWLRLPAGRISLRAGGLGLQFTAYGLELRFDGLRAELSCRGGQYILAAVTSGVKGRSLVQAAQLSATGEVTIECERRWSLFCLALVFGKPLHNTVALLPYATRECCEAAFAQDHSGCLVGGQFNGRVLGSQYHVTNVTCERGMGGFVAQCETIPGNYTKISPGICREWGLPSWTRSVSNPGWDSLHHSIELFAWADVLLTLAVCWCCLVCCCRGQHQHFLKPGMNWPELPEAMSPGHRRRVLSNYSPVRVQEPAQRS